MKTLIILITVFVIVFALGMAVYWLGGGEFVRGADLVWSVIVSIFNAALCACFTLDYLKGNI